jgi:hypothetical protein
MGSKPSWYDGPSDRKPSVNGWINHAKNCMGAPNFKEKNIKFKYTPKVGEKKFSSGWAYKNSQGRWVHGETYLNSKTNFTVIVATTPQGVWDEDSNQTEGHEVGHVVGYNQFSEAAHPSKWRHCFAGWQDKLTDDIYETVYGENGQVIHDSSYHESEDPPPPPQGTGCPASGGSKSNLIKPSSDSDGKLVLVLSCEYLRNTSSCNVWGEKGRDSTNYEELPNGARVHFRFSKSGGQYGTQTINLKLKNGSELCYTDSMASRKEGWKFKQCETTPTKLYDTTSNSLTLRQDFQDSVSKVDVLVNINETLPGQATSTVVGASKNGATWTIPNALSSYPRGNRVNTWRVRLTKVPPKDVTYHTSIMQTFIRETEIAEGKGKTYPPTTRQ